MSNLAGGVAAASEVAVRQGLVSPQTMTERLVARKEALEAQLAETNDALEALTANPELQDAVDKIAKIGHF